MANNLEGKVEELVEASQMIKQFIPKKNFYERPIWEGILKLLVESNYGKSNYEVEIDCPLPPNQSSYDEMMDGGFDGVQIQVLNICNTIFGKYGEISMVPYSQGLGTRSLKVSYKSGGKQNEAI
jgi:hypothetical protein